MNQHDRTESVFAAAVALASQADRAAYLDQACADDPAMRQRVEALLRAHDQSRHFLDQSAVPRRDTVEHVPDAVIGTLVAGRYKLLETIGEGGMGTVWMAEQREPVKRLVALKLIKAGMDSKAVLARFEAERQALALMDHPQIAKVLDGGTSADGHPYFVMELVKGLTLTEYCDDRRLSVEDRLQLFVQICSAVQHAHQKGIIHRDLKPSNILVTEHDGKPVPKVIDFGLAKALGAATVLTERTLHTAYGTVVGTPLYMAPEQVGINALDVDTRTDLYALGAILYELLTGTTPLEKRRYKEVAWEEVKRLIREEEPPRPSLRLSSSDALPSLAAQRQTEPAKLSRLVQGDLDWIVLKALEKDRNRRYETANGLALDVQRHLRGEPVLAVPPSVSYRLRKFLRRRRGPVLAAALVLLALLAGITATTWGFVEAVNQRDAADEARAAEVVQRHNAEVNARKATAAAAEEIRQRQNADAHANKAKEAAEEERQAREREAEQRKAAVAAQQRAMEALRATTDDVIEHLLSARPMLGPTEKAFMEATLKRWQVFAAENGDSEEARAIRAEGLFRVARLRNRLGEREAALADYCQAIGLLEKLAADFPAVPDYRIQLAQNHHNLGLLLHDLGKDVEAAEHYRQALGLLEKLPAEFQTVPVFRHQWAVSHHNLGLVLNGLGKWQEAQEHYRQALRLHEQLAGEFPAVLDYRRALALSHHNLAILLHKLKKWAEAEEHYRQALDLREPLVTKFPAVPAFRLELAANHNSLGVFFQDLRRSADAEEHYRQALALQEQLVAEFPAVPAYRQALADSHTNLGNLLKAQGKGAEAEQRYRKALGMQKKLAADFPTSAFYRQQLARTHFNMGNLLTGLSRHPEAEEHYREALGLQKKLAADFPAIPAYREDLADSLTNLGILVQTLGRHPEAEELYREALGLQKKLAAEFPTTPTYLEELARTHYNLGILFKNLGKHMEAEEQFRQRLALRMKLAAEFRTDAAYHVDLGGSLVNFGHLVRDSGKPTESLDWYARAIAILTTVLQKEPGHATAQLCLRNAHWGRARALDQLGRHEEAVKDWDRAVALSPTEGPQEFLKTKRALSRVKAGQVAAAVAEVDELTRSTSWPAAAWYDFACVHALASGKDKDKKDNYAVRAVELLQRAIKAGYRNVEQLRKDADLDPLRGRDDFRELVESLAKTTNPTAK
jgi:serine/threonine protein kinase/tetratricopeptide (TPR) repeat protein